MHNIKYRLFSRKYLCLNHWIVFGLTGGEGGGVVEDLLLLAGLLTGLVQLGVRHPLVDLQQLRVLVRPAAELAAALLQPVHRVPVVVQLVGGVEHLQQQCSQYISPKNSSILYLVTTFQCNDSTYFK